VYFDHPGKKNILRIANIANIANQNMKTLNPFDNFGIFITKEIVVRYYLTKI
jgi:hypothetical protein